MAEKKNTTMLQMNIVKLLAETDMSNAAIAAHLACSTETVRAVKKNPELKNLIIEKQKELYSDLVPLAIRELRTILRAENVQGTVKIAAIREVLERSHFNEITDNTDKEIKITVSYE